MYQRAGGHNVECGKGVGGRGREELPRPSFPIAVRVDS